jgi:apolipoprotein D and lipocalin family protein
MFEPGNKRSILLRSVQRLALIFMLSLSAQIDPVCAEEQSAAEIGDNPVETVDMVDLERYAGLWYEIAKIPNRFQKQCARGATAEYMLHDDGSIGVINRCIKDNGEADVAEGIAKIEDPATNAKLKVSFVSFLGWRPFWGDYWILGLDEDYQWALVGTPDRKYGWILARTPELEKKTLRDIREIIERNGYDPAAFEMSPP